MPGDNALNNERWKLHGSNADFWRCDNPFIISWYRFGEDPFPISALVGEPERTDSASHHHYLDTATEPNTFMQHVSGLAPWSNSGIMFDGASWGAGTVSTAIYVDQAYLRERTDSTALGYYGIGSSMVSGITIMGWVQVTDTATNPTTPRKIIGNIEDTVSALDGEWMLTITPSNRDVQFTYNSAGTGDGTAVHTVSTVNDPNNVTDPNEPFFFACQISKGNPVTHPSINEGSGIIRIFLGTTISGLREVDAHQVTVPSTNFWRGDNTEHGLTNFTYTIGADPQSARGNANAAHLPPSSIVDEFILVLDGDMSLDRMAHYMNSGIIQDDQDPLGLTTPFVPVAPGVDDLVAYWSFDNQDGENSSPNTSGIVGLDMFTNGVTFVDGIRGGFGIRTNSVITRLNAFTYPTNKNGLAHVPGGSGLNYLFPEKDQTWIGWVRSEGASHRGGALGWFSPTANVHMATYWQDYILLDGAPRSGQVDMGMTPSGGHPFTTLQTLAGISTNFSPNSARNMANGDWHLMAVVWDITHGLTRVVIDARDVYPQIMYNTVQSGFTKEFLTANPDTAGFAFGNRDATSRCSYDDWAVYDRILTLPEMSGYAVSGIAEFKFTSPIDTSFKRTLGYWKLDAQEVYDPENVSGIRYSDTSWYRHHLTQVSGNFQQGDGLNVDIGMTTAEVTHSGSILAVPINECGSNLDFSASGVWATSGFTAGCWMYVPSGDLETQGNGSSGLFGDKMFMGAWGQGEDEQSWFLGMRDNTFLVGIKLPNLPPNYIESLSGIPFNEPFFVALKAVPSGSNTTVEIYSSTDLETTLVSLVGRDVGIGGTNNLGTGGVSGFSLFGTANLQYGFPSGTRMQMPFVYAGELSNGDLGIVKLAGVNDNVLESGSVAFNDPTNISHWRLDEYGAQSEDRGQAQNFLTIINDDGHQIGVEPAIHSQGVTIRQPEYLTTRTDFATSGLDLATDGKSWTFLTWIKPNADTPTNEAVIMGKGGATSGIEILMNANSNNPSSRASGISTQAYNGDLAPGEWNHLAVVFDRDNDEFETIVNGRYAGGEFIQLLEVPPNNSGLALGGRGSQVFLAIAGGTSFSGVLDDTMLFSRALTLPEISGLAANSYNFTESVAIVSGQSLFGGYITGIAQNIVSGLIGAFVHGQAQDIELIAGYISGVSGVFDHIGGFIHGRAFASGLFGAFMHGADQVSGLFGHFIHGVDQASGFIGSWLFGAEQNNAEFDVILNFRVVTFEDFDARLGVEKTQIKEFDSRLGVIHITRPPDCTLEMPLVGEVGSGTPYTLTIQGSGIAFENKKVSLVRFTFADFKDAELGTLVAGVSYSGLYEASRTFDTPGWYTVKIEVLDSFGYRSSCCRPFLLLPTGSTSGAYLATLPGIQLASNLLQGSTIQRVLFEHSLSGLSTTSGILEYTDFADQQETLVNSLEMPSGSQIFMSGFREHDYTMPGRYCPVWAVSGNWGIVSDSIAGGIDYLL